MGPGPQAKREGRPYGAQGGARERVRAWRPHEWQRLALLLGNGAANGLG